MNLKRTLAGLWFSVLGGLGLVADSRSSFLLSTSGLVLKELIPRFCTVTTSLESQLPSFAGNSSLRLGMAGRVDLAMGQRTAMVAPSKTACLKHHMPKIKK